MIVLFEPEAEATLFEVAYFIDCINVEGAGDKWIDRFIGTIYSYAKLHLKYALCNNEYLASLGLSCVSIKDWIVAFKIEDGIFVVYKILRGSFLL